MKIDIRPGDIKAAIKLRKQGGVLGLISPPWSCPAALAARRCFKQGAAVTEEMIILGDGAVFSLPPEAVQWISDFDSGLRVEPIEFTVFELVWRA